MKKGVRDFFGRVGGVVVVVEGLGSLGGLCRRRWRKRVRERARRRARLRL